MDKGAQEDDRYQRRRKWIKSILSFSSDENDSESEIKDESNVSYPLDTGPLIALRFPYPMISDESEEEDNVIILPTYKDKKRKLSCSTDSEPIGSLNYKHKKRKKNCISDSEDNNSDNGCDMYLTPRSTKIRDCKTKCTKNSKSLEISDKENRLSLKRTLKLSQSEDQNLFKKKRCRQNDELFENSFDLKNSKAYTSKKEINKGSRFLDSSSENDETSSHKKIKTKSKFRRVRVLSTSSSSSDGEYQDSNNKSNPSPSSNLSAISPNCKSPEISQENESDSEYTPAIEECLERKQKLSIKGTKPLLSNNNSNAWKNIANINFKSQPRQFGFPSKVQSLKKLLLSCNMSSVEVHKKIYSKPINISNIKETSAKPKNLKYKSNIPGKFGTRECLIGVSSPSSSDKHNSNEVETNSVASIKQLEGMINPKKAPQNETDKNIDNTSKLKETSVLSTSEKVNHLNVFSKSESRECTTDNISAASATSNSNKTETMTNYFPLNKHSEGLVSGNESELDKNVESEIPHIDTSQNIMNINDTTSVDNTERVPMVNTKVRQSRYKQSEHTPHMKQTSAKPEHKKVETKSAERNTSHEKESISDPSGRQIDILGDIISQMDKNPYKTQKPPSKQIAQTSAEALGWGPLGDSFDFAGRFCQNPLSKSQVPDKEPTQSKQISSTDFFLHDSIKSHINNKNHTIIPTTVGNNKAKANPTEISSNNLLTDNKNPNESSSISLPIKISRMQSGVIIPFYSAQSEEYIPNTIGRNIKRDTPNIDSVSKNSSSICTNLPIVEENKNTKQCSTESCFTKEKDSSSSNYSHNNRILNPTTSKKLSTPYSKSTNDVSNKNVKEGLIKPNANRSNNENTLEGIKQSQVKINELCKTTLDTRTNFKCRKTDLIQTKTKNMEHKVEDKHLSNRVKNMMVKGKRNQVTDRYSVKDTPPNKAEGGANGNKPISGGSNIIDNKVAITARVKNIYQQVDRESSLKTIKGPQKNKEAYCSKSDESALTNVDEHITCGSDKDSEKQTIGEIRKEFSVQNLISDDKEIPKSRGVRIKFGGIVYRIPGSQNSGNKNDKKVEFNSKHIPENKNLNEHDSSIIKNCLLQSAKNVSSTSNILNLGNVDMHSSKTDDINSCHTINRNNRKVSSSDDSTSSDSSSSETTSGSTSTRPSKLDHSNTDNHGPSYQKTVNLDNLCSESDKSTMSSNCLTSSTHNILNRDSVILSHSSDSVKSNIVVESNTDTKTHNTNTQVSERVRSEPVAPIVGKIRVRTLKELGAINESHVPDNALSQNLTPSLSTLASSELTKSTAQSEQVLLQNTKQSLSRGQIPNNTKKNESSVSPQIMHSNLDSLFKMNISSTNKPKSVAVIKPISSPTEKSTVLDLPNKHLSKVTTEISKNVTNTDNELKSGPSTECRNEEQTIKLPIPVEGTQQSKENELMLIQVPLANKGTEVLFFQLCDNLFTDLLYCKIPKLVDDLHLLILYDSMREERLKKISQLSCGETIASEKKRIEKDFSDHIKVRSYSFVPLFMTIVSKINKSDFRALVIAVYCRIIQHLEKVDPVNANYRFKVRFIIKSMLEKSNCKDDCENLTAIFGQSDSDFLPTFVFIEHLLQKYDSYVEERQKLLTDKTNTNTGKESCNTTEKIAASACTDTTTTSSTANIAKENSNSSFSSVNKSTRVIASTSQTSIIVPVCISTYEGKQNTNKVTNESTPKPSAPTTLIGNLDQMLRFKVTPTKKMTQ